MLSGGLSFFWVSPVMARLKEKGNLTLTTEEVNWIVSLVEVGDALAPIPTGLLVNMIGRKWTVSLAAPLFLTPWLLLLSSQSLSILYCSRIIQGKPYIGEHGDSIL